MKKNLCAIFLMHCICFSAEYSLIKKEIINQLTEIGAIKTGNFTLKNGSQSSIYLDMRMTYSKPDLIKKIAHIICQMIESLDFDHICPVPYGAVPLATMISVDRNKSLIIPRKEIKKYGMARSIEGVYQSGQNCLIIEDVITTGSSILETIEKVENEGLKIVAVIVLIDREEGGLQRLEQLGYKTIALFKISEIIHNNDFAKTEKKVKSFGGQSMVKPLKKVLVRRPDESFAIDDYQKWHYMDRPILKIAQQEHDDFIGILANHGVEVIYHNELLADHADAIFVHDPVLITNQGAIILRMGKLLRQGEEDAIERTLHRHGIPTFYKLYGAATAEGGDILWLNEHTLAIGRGFRTNDAGIDQIKHAIEPLGIDVIKVELPYDQGKDSCLHLQSLISLVDEKMAVIYKNFLPVSFIEYLLKSGFDLIEVPDDEYFTMGPNILAVAPKICLTIRGNTETKKRLEAAGCTVFTYKGDEISCKAEGGATCLTRPLLRA